MSAVYTKHFSYFLNNKRGNGFPLIVSQRRNLLDLSALAQNFGGIPLRNMLWLNKQPSLDLPNSLERVQTQNEKSICSPWLQNNTIKHSLRKPLDGLFLIHSNML